jgi:hypothetical protein
MNINTLGLITIHMLNLRHQVKRWQTIGMKRLDDHLKERRKNHMLGTQILSIQGFGASNFHIWWWDLGKWLEKTLIERFLLKACRCIWCLTYKCVLPQPTTFYWLNLENFLWNSMLLSYLYVVNGHVLTTLLMVSQSSIPTLTCRTRIWDPTQINKPSGNPWQTNTIKSHIPWSQTNPLNNPIRNKFSSPFENVGSLKFSFQLDHQVDIRVTVVGRQGQHFHVE